MNHKQYCRYCEQCSYKNVNGIDTYYCVKLGFALRPSAVVRKNTCKSYAFDGFDCKTGREYVPIEERRKPIDGQIMLN